MNSLTIPVHPDIRKDLERLMTALHKWPVTIFPARYGGVYEGASWLAVASHNIPEFAQGPDVDCSKFFELNGDQIGRGVDPNLALQNLIDRVGYDAHGFLRKFKPAKQETWYR